MLNEILYNPIVTEKMTKMAEKSVKKKDGSVITYSKYGFVVNREANKLQIKKAVEDLYNVQVDDVNTMRYRGKRKSRYTKAGFINGRENNYKKAIVTLAQGDKIDFFSNI